MRKITFHNIARKRNLKVERDAFISGKKAYPNLKLSFRHDADQVDSFIDYISDKDQKLQYNLVKASTNADVEEYRKLIEEKYGPPSEQIFKDILSYLDKRSKRTGTEQEYAKICSELNIQKSSNPLYTPDKEVFQHYRSLFASIFETELKVIKEHVKVGQSYEKSMSKVAQKIGLDKNGWEVKQGVKGNGVFVLGVKKKIIVPISRKIDNKSRAEKVFAHELLVHVYRRDNGVAYSKEEEALGVLVEQLLDARYMHRRTIRYFAAAAAWGVDGTRRDFRQTYELVRRVIQIITGAKSNKVLSYKAFNETARVFNGGHPEIPGFVLLKDIVYLSSSIELWKQLSLNKLSEQEFKELLIGSKQ